MVNGATGAFAAIIATFLPVPKEAGKVFKVFRRRVGRIFSRSLHFPWLHGVGWSLEIYSHLWAKNQ